MRREKLGFIFITVSVVCLMAAVGIQLSLREDPATVHIDAEGSIAYRFEIDGDIDEVGYDVEVVEGPYIDVYVLTESDYTRYLDGLRPIDDDSMVFEVVDSIHGSPYLFRGSYWFVLDNSDYGTENVYSENATVEYRFSPLEPDREPEVQSFIYYGLSGSFVLFLVLGIVLVVLGYTGLNSDSLRF